MATETETFKLDELAEQAGVSARTVRYYVQRGLLPAPTFRGKDTAYDRGHLVRLRAIRRLQERFLPLDAIQEELDRRTPAELERLADGKDMPAPAPQIPAPAPRVGVTSERFERFVLAPGLELQLSDGASAAVRALAEMLVEQAMGRKGPGGRGR